MDEAKIYNVCLQRVKFQITNAKKRLAASHVTADAMVLESYNTGDLVEIIDILEIYDLEDHTPQGLKEKLQDLAYTVSVMVRDTIAFDFDDKGHLALYWVVEDAAAVTVTENEEALAAA
ncbi:MAG: hypothetical protein EPN25_06705 [Nitrospirae bacterium]|nr:MAG: hypothetical protein EPN25_06705 [Nitrospirota bacterium]